MCSTIEHLAYARSHVADSAMRSADLCAAATHWSDNTAGNLILAAVGGPSGFTAFAHCVGDAETRLDRNETNMNESIPGQPRHDDAARDGRGHQKEASRRQLEARPVIAETLAS
jgi:beta-lactamase class A